jgi:hypothetical protein
VRVNMDISQIVTHSNKEDYLLEEVLALEKAYHSLVAKSQGEEISLDETRVIVAYKRYQQERNFKIVAEKAAKKVREPKAPKEPRVKKPKALSQKDKNILLTMRDLLEGGQLTLEGLSEEKRNFYEMNKDRV